MRKLALILIVLSAVFGCTPTEKLKYTVNETGSKNQYTNDRSEKRIEPYDYLYIKIYSLDPTTNEIFNPIEYGNNNQNLEYYGVSDQGYISFPFIGKLLVKDLTIEEAQNQLEKELNKYLTNISLRMRFVGNQITVVGEVEQPGNYTFYDEKITIFQALGLAGDIADFGNKTNVALLREQDNIITYHYLDLTDKNIVTSDYYYLIPNDIVVVDPVKAKYRSMQDRSIITLIVATLTSTTTTVLSILSYQNSLNNTSGQ